MYALLLAFATTGFTGTPTYCSQPSTTPMDLLDAAGKGWAYEATLAMEDGGLVVLQVTNPGKGVNLLIDAGTVFEGPEGYQPAVVTEDVLVFVPSGATEEVVLVAACGEASAMAGSDGLVFDQGIHKLPEELCRILDRIQVELHAHEMVAQDLIWVYTDDHPLASVYAEDGEQSLLLEILAEEVEGFEDPGYAVQYREPDPEEGGQFTGEAMKARCRVTVDLPSTMDCRVVMIQPNGERIPMMSHTLTAGPHEFYLTIGLEGYPSGEYTLQLESERFGNTIFRRELHLQDRA